MVQSVPPSTFQYSDGVTKKQNQLQKPWEARHSSALCDTWLHDTLHSSISGTSLSSLTFSTTWDFANHNTSHNLPAHREEVKRCWFSAVSHVSYTFSIISLLASSMTDNVNFLSRNSSSGFAASSSPLQSRSPRPGIHPVPRKEQSEDS